MYLPSFATPLSLFLTFYTALSLFSGTAVANGPDLLFTKFDNPPEIPAALIHCPNERPITLSNILKQTAQGQPLFLHLWSPFCGPCQTEMRQLDRVKPLLTAQKVTVLVIAQDHQGAVSVPSFARRYSIKNLGLCYDQAGTTLLTLRPSGLPATYVVSSAGQITAVHEGSIDWSALTETLQQ